jgi:hypothetical protein
MHEQPLPAANQWPWNANFKRKTDSGPTVGSLSVLEGVREGCTQCGDLIAPDKIAYVLNLRLGQKWLKLHFHPACYDAWEPSAGAQRELLLISAPHHPPIL